MSENKNKNNNKSLFIYTALIFIVAVLLILLSFFGQTHLKNSQPKVEVNEEQQTGIAERASVLSEENKTLIEENNKLKEENKTLVEKQTENDLLLAANGYFTLGNKDKAFELILAVDYETLSADQKIIYDTIKAGIEAAE